MKKIGFVKALSISTIFSLMAATVQPLLAFAAPTDSVSPTVSITAPTNGATISGVINITANATDVFSSCVVRIFGQSYDVSVLGSTHTGGNVFNCGTNMDAVYAAQHGTNTARIQPYLIPSTYVGVTRVEFFVDGALIGADTVSPYSLSWDSAQVSNGSHTIQVKASDGLNIGSSSIINVTVNNSTQTPTPTTTPNPTPSPTTTPNPTPSPTSTPTSTPSNWHHDDDEDEDGIEVESEHEDHHGVIVSNSRRNERSFRNNREDQRIRSSINTVRSRSLNHERNDD